MILTSTAFPHNGSIPPQYTCDGNDVSPPLAVTDVPREAKSLALLMEDPDVPRSIRQDGMWDHWVVFNIPPGTREIPEGTGPAGTPGKGTGGHTAYQGPCPPDREHRYFFRVYALDSTLHLPPGATKADVQRTMESHILATTELIGRYARQR